MVSYWDHEKEVAEPIYFKEWNEELWIQLQTDPWIEGRDGLIYHLTRNAVTVERWRVVDLIAKKGMKVKYDPQASGRKNWHIKGKQALKKMT